MKPRLTLSFLSFQVYYLTCQEIIRGRFVELLANERYCIIEARTGTSSMTLCSVRMYHKESPSRGRTWSQLRSLYFPCTRCCAAPYLWLFRTERTADDEIRSQAKASGEGWGQLHLRPDLRKRYAWQCFEDGFQLQKTLFREEIDLGA